MQTRAAVAAAAAAAAAAAVRFESCRSAARARARLSPAALIPPGDLIFRARLELSLARSRLLTIAAQVAVAVVDRIALLAY